ncbi:hypothetical protein N825_26425 [Skermanella stibiiresistens SB22]|uniref:Uncharacterized protein n=1 Tax=Skermanella stibiiresistens SB22 TaxID=1385369 RepID=W9GRN4_9PROT|nr:hypothetical protein N825_26425 [Skermanella stibiiresistens SB22]
MPSTFWMLVCLYLIVAAVSVMETGFVMHEDSPLAPVVVCLVALLHGLGWPFRMALDARRP